MKLLNLLSTTRLLVLLVTLLSSHKLLAQSLEDISISGGVNLATEYIWRGIEQTSDEAAISGNFDISHASGLYAGIWASNVNFGPGAPESLEADLYVGWGKSYDNGFGIDVGYLAYTYKGDEAASAVNFSEIYLTSSYEGFSASYYSGNGDADDYFEVSYGHDFEKLSVSALYGYYDLDDAYGYYGLGLSTQIKGIDLALNWTDNDADDANDTNLVFSIGGSF